MIHGHGITLRHIWKKMAFHFAKLWGSLCSKLIDNIDTAYGIKVHFIFNRFTVVR
jgi:hypothetical protein